MKRKIVTLICMIVLIMATLTVTVFARISSASCTLSSAKQEYKKGDKVVVTLRLSSLNADKGIIAYSAKLDYDKSNLQYVSCSGVGNWTAPFYNDDSGILVADRNGDFSSLDGEDLATFTFNVIGEEAENVKIAVTNIELSNGTAGTASDVTTYIDVVKDTTEPDNPDDPDDPDNPNAPDDPSDPDDPSNPDSPDDPSDPNDPDTPDNPDKSDDTDKTDKPDTPSTPSNPNKPNQKDDTISQDPIPQTGGNKGNIIFLTLLGIAVTLVVVFLVKIKIINKKIKRSGARYK